MALDEKRRYLLDKVFMAFGSQMHACEHNPLSTEWREFRQEAWVWAVKNVGELIEYVFKDPSVPPPPNPESPPEPPAPPAPAKSEYINEKQVKLFWRIAREHKWEDEELKVLLAEGGIDSTQKIPWKRFNNLLDVLKQGPDAEIQGTDEIPF